MSLPAWPALVAVAALAGWLLAPEPTPSTPLVQPRRDAWTPAPLPRRADASTQAAMAVGAPFWGKLGVQAAAPAAPPEPRWRAAGVFGQGAARVLFVSFVDDADARPPLRLRVGDKLPSGQRITRIGDREYCVRIDGKDYRMGIERSDS